MRYSFFRQCICRHLEICNSRHWWLQYWLIGACNNWAAKTNFIYGWIDCEEVSSTPSTPWRVGSPYKMSIFLYSQPPSAKRASYSADHSYAIIMLPSKRPRRHGTWMKMTRSTNQKWKEFVTTLVLLYKNHYYRANHVVDFCLHPLAYIYSYCEIRFAFVHPAHCWAWTSLRICVIIINNKTE